MWTGRIWGEVRERNFRERRPHDNALPVWDKSTNYMLMMYLILFCFQERPLLCFFPASLRYNSHITLCKFKAQKASIWFSYMLRDYHNRVVSGRFHRLAYPFFFCGDTISDLPSKGHSWNIYVSKHILKAGENSACWNVVKGNTNLPQGAGGVWGLEFDYLLGRDLLHSRRDTRSAFHV